MQYRKDVAGVPTNAVLLLVKKFHDCKITPTSDTQGGRDVQNVLWYIPVSLLRTLLFLIFQIREDSELTLRMAAFSCVRSVSLLTKPMA